MNKTDIHPIQSEILCSLLFVNEAGFSELNSHNLGSDQFSFHLRQLVGWKLVNKNSDGRYTLTTKGKEYANRFDTDEKEIERQPKIGVVVIAIRQEGEAREYLMQKRLKQPYYGFWGFVTGKVRWGETVEETAQRELYEETGLSGKVKLIGLKHKMDYDQEQNLLEDKFFLVCQVDSIEGELKEKFEGGENYWMKRKDIEELDDLFDGVIDNLTLLEEDGFHFMENKYKVKGY